MFAILRIQHYHLCRQTTFENYRREAAIDCTVFFFFQGKYRSELSYAIEEVFDEEFEHVLDSEHFRANLFLYEYYNLLRKENIDNITIDNCILP